MKEIFIPSTQMTFETVIEDKRRLNAFFENLTQQKWIFDLTQVTSCDSAGVALLIEAKRLSQTQQRICQFQGISSAMQMWIQFCGVEDVLFTSSEEMQESLLC